MNLKQFVETYKKLEKKVYKIMKIYDLENYILDSISIEDYNKKTYILHYHYIIMGVIQNIKTYLLI